MRYVNAWQSTCGIVLLSDEALVVLQRYRQTGAAPEAGGILVGLRRGNHFDVVAASGPQPGDVRRRGFFERNPGGHQEFAYEAWARSGGLADYLGEWHTHSEGSPSPSAIDLREWRKLRSPRVPMVGVIAGTRSLYVALISATGNVTRCEEAPNGPVSI